MKWQRRQEKFHTTPKHAKAIKEAIKIAKEDLWERCRDRMGEEDFKETKFRFDGCKGDSYSISGRLESKDFIYSFQYEIDIKKKEVLDFKDEGVSFYISF